jgi:hypothetical protein
MAKKRYDQKYANFYSRFYDNLTPNMAGECSVKAFCHDDQKESMSINLLNGKYRCHACDKGGYVYDFYKEYRELIEGENIDINYSKSICDDIMDGKEVDETIVKLEFDLPDSDIIEAKHEALLDERGAEFYKFLTTERGLIRDTILQRKLMWWSAERIGIPIPEHGRYVGVRCYGTNNKNKMIWDKTGRTCKLYPLDNLQVDEPILLCEGEMDCILANQLGYNAMTVTGGAGTWKETFSPLFKDKIVWICYDTDKTGDSGSFKVATSLYDYAKEVKIIHLPIRDDKNKDITDFFVKLGHSKSDLDAVIDNTPTFKPASRKKVDNCGIKSIELNDINNYHGKPYEIRCMVAGKNPSSYLVPTKYCVRCIPMSNGNMCPNCPCSVSTSSALEMELEPTERTILQLFECSDNEKQRVLKENAGIPVQCLRCSIEEQDTISIKQVMLTPDIDYSSEKQEYVLREAYVIDDDVETSQSYLMRGTTWSHPKDQRAVSQINYVERTRDNVASFQMTPDLYEQLKVFQAEKGRVGVKIKDIIKDLSLNVTKIYGRDDLHIATDLVFHSALAFNFNGKFEKRGWVECLLLGDTRTGKSETVQRLIEHYRAGEFLTGESTSFAGLVGGVNTNGRRNMVTWGKIPMNDRRLVAIDEVSGMPIETLEKMSGVRSSGVAEINKIQIERTHARTRLIWISNDREGKGLGGSGTYGGVDALIELFGKMEDIARFEFVVTAANGEVPLEEINKRMEQLPQVDHIYTSNLSNNLIMWVWSRKPEQIHFTTEAIDAIYNAANLMGEKYVPSVLPLVEGANQRVKLARLATAVACRLFSTTDGNDVVVLPEHVEYVVNYLNLIYSKESFGYAQLSDMENQKKAAIDMVYKEVIGMFASKRNIGDIFMTLKYFAINELEYMLNVDREESKKLITYLIKRGLVTRSGNVYRKTDMFNTILRRWKGKG